MGFNFYLNGPKWLRFLFQSTIESNFKTAWTKFGQNKWIEAETFNRDYVEVLQVVVDGMRPLVGTNSPWTDDLNNKWISELRIFLESALIFC